MNIKKATVAAMLAAAATTWGAPLTPDQALQRALGTAPAGMARAPQSYTVAYTRPQAYYVFNSATPAGGFVIASADEAMRPLLGYGQGTIDPENIPCNLQMMLDIYAEQAARATAAPYTPAAPCGTPIDVMIESKWDQLDPFNLLTPTIRGNHTPTGCVATGMAQVMRYYRHPVDPSGSISYTPQIIRQEISVDFSQSHYDWDKMPYVYSTTSTDEQNNAVAQLMRDCGASVRMEYNTAATGGSGTTSNYIPTAISRHFDYSGEADLIYRDFYTQSEWDAIVYAELAKGRPVLYIGAAPSGGHAFIADGYNADGLFHINWGWSGLADGWFALSTLNPGTQGTGGFEGGYTIQQNIVANMVPATDATRYTSIHVLGLNDFYTDGESNFGFQMWGNSTKETVTVTPGIEIVPAEGGESIFFFSDKAETFEADMGTYGTYHVDPPTGLAPGNYRVYPAYSNDVMGIRRMPVRDSTRGALYLWVGANGALHYSTGEDAYEGSPLRVTNLTTAAADHIEAGKTATFIVTLTNPTEKIFTGPVTFTIAADGDSSDSFSHTEASLTLEPGATQSLTLENVALKEVLYAATVTCGDDSTVADGCPVEFRANAADAADIVLETRPTLAGETFFRKNAIKGTLSVTNAGTAPFEGALKLRILSAETSEKMLETETPTLSVAAGATVATDIYILSALAPGSYLLTVNDDAPFRLPYGKAAFEIVNQTALISSLSLPERREWFVADTPADLGFIIKAGDTDGFHGLLRLYVRRPGEEELIATTVAPFERESTQRETLTLEGLTLAEGIYEAGIVYQQEGSDEIDLTDDITDSPRTLYVGENSSISAVAAAGVSVAAGAGEIHIRGLREGDIVTLTDAAGAIIASREAHGPTMRLAPGRGFYIVTIAGATYKVVVR